jgi:hypothetical protein
MTEDKPDEPSNDELSEFGSHDSEDLPDETSSGSPALIFSYGLRLTEIQHIQQDMA